jgi:aspartyl-tRNA(Asn)/glutamyl-tRNA(Gln) amidotransferase subunit A
MSGKDEMDTTSSSNPDTSYLPFAEEQVPKKIGYIQEALESDSIDLEVKNRMLAFIENLKEEGHTVEPVHLEELKYLVPAYYMLTTAEASSNLARYDGIHYGRRSENSTDIESTYTESRTEGFGPEVKRRILLGTFVLSAGYYDAYYAKAQRVRNKIKMKTEELFKSYDFLLSPTTPSTAFKFGENMDDPIKMYLEDLFTVHANLVGMPAISLPLGKSSTNSLPFGLQFMAPPFQEKALFEFSHNLMHRAALKA